MNLRPRSDIIYVIPSARVEETYGSIILPPPPSDREGRETLTKGKIVKVGPDCVELKPGDEVLHTKWTGTEFEFEDEKYLVMHEEDVMAVMGSVPERIYDIHTDTFHNDVTSAYAYAVDSGYQGSIEEYKEWLQNKEMVSE